MARLVEVDGWFARHKSHPSCGHQPKTTSKLIEKGLIMPRGGKVAKTGRIMWHADAVLTDAGRAMLTEGASS